MQGVPKNHGLSVVMMLREGRDFEGNAADGQFLEVPFNRNEHQDESTQQQPWYLWGKIHAPL